MLVVVFIFFGQLGIHFFGGVISSHTPLIYAQRSGGSMSTNYEILNFNDFPNSLMMLWALLVNNCWPTLTISAVSRDNQPYQMVFFVVFILVTCVVILNIVVGFVIDVILAYLGEATLKDDEFGMAEMLQELESGVHEDALKNVTKG